MTPWIDFFLPAPIMGKGRPRMNRKGEVYTPETTKQFEQRVKFLGMRAARTQGVYRPSEGALLLCGDVFYPRPKSRKLPEEATFCALGPPSYADLSNIIKGVEDALNGVFWEDDRQIVELRWTKNWAAADQEPGIAIRVYEHWDTVRQ